MASKIPQIGILNPSQVRPVNPFFVYWVNTTGQVIGWVNASTAPVYWA